MHISISPCLFPSLAPFLCQAVSRKNKVPAMFLLAYYDRLTVLDKALNDDVNDKEHVTWSPTWTSQRPSKIGTSPRALISRRHV
jgi:hypothetical protein